MNWRPMSLRGGALDPRFDEPSEGLPPWLKGPVLQWVRSAFQPGVGWHKNALQAVQLDFRLERPLGFGVNIGPGDDLLRRAGRDDEFALDLLDWMVYNHNYFSAGHASE